MKLRVHINVISEFDSLTTSQCKEISPEWNSFSVSKAAKTVSEGAIIVSCADKAPTSKNVEARMIDLSLV